MGLANVEQLSPKGDGLELVVVVDEGDDIFMAGGVLTHDMFSLGLRGELLFVLIACGSASVGAIGLLMACSAQFRNLIGDDTAVYGS